MITIPTVLIFGAGVSQAFGFPSGLQLCKNVIANTRPGSKMLETDRYSGEDIITFGNALFYSGRNSVDAFLEHERKFTEVGKAAIAQELIKYEILDRLFDRDNNLYSYLFDQLSTSAKEFTKNRLSVITFNYDRSFEQYMFMALKNSYGLHDEAAAEMVDSLNIIHLHGHLGLLPWQKKERERAGQFGGGRQYENKVDRFTIKEGSRSIKIIHQAADDDSGFVMARTILSGTQRIIFLGFGYAEANVSRLRIDLDQSKEILGSVFGFKLKELLELSDRFDGCLNSSDSEWPNGGYSTLDGLSFLRSKVWLQQKRD